MAFGYGETARHQGEAEHVEGDDGGGCPQTRECRSGPHNFPTVASRPPSPSGLHGLLSSMPDSAWGTPETHDRSGGSEHDARVITETEVPKVN